MLCGPLLTLGPAILCLSPGPPTYPGASLSGNMLFAPQRPHKVPCSAHSHSPPPRVYLPFHASPHQLLTTGLRRQCTSCLISQTQGLHAEQSCMQGRPGFMTPHMTLMLDYGLGDQGSHSGFPGAEEVQCDTQGAPACSSESSSSEACWCLFMPFRATGVRHGLGDTAWFPACTCPRLGS